MSRIRVATAGSAVALLAALLVLGIAAPASAHSQVISSDPASGSTISTLPAEFSVTANEDLADLTGTGQGFALVVVGSDGTKYQGTPLTIDGPKVSTPSVALPPGNYELQYQIVSADTHPVSGSIPFTYAPDGAVVPTAAATKAAAGGGTGGADEVPIGAWLVPLAILVAGAIVWIVAGMRRKP